MIIFLSQEVHLLVSWSDRAGAGVLKCFLQPSRGCPVPEPRDREDAGLTVRKKSFLNRGERVDPVTVVVGDAIRRGIPLENLIRQMFPFGLWHVFRGFKLAFDKMTFVRGRQFAAVHFPAGVEDKDGKDSRDVLPDFVAPAVSLVDLEDLDCHGLARRFPLLLAGCSYGYPYVLSTRPRSRKRQGMLLEKSL